MRLYIILLCLFFKMESTFSQDIPFRIPEPRLDLSIYTGVVFVNPNRAFSSYNSNALAKYYLNFPAQKEFGSSANFGFDIFYPSSEKYHIGFNFDYLESNLFARYEDIYGSYDLEANISNYTYQFIPRLILNKKNNSFWYVQGGIGGSFATEKSTESFTDSDLLFDQTINSPYEINRSQTLFGFMTSAKTGFNYHLKRLSLGASIGYRSSFNFEGNNSIIHGFTTNASFGLNLLK